MVRIFIVSDIHTEFLDEDEKVSFPSAEILILAGDIGNPYSSTYTKILLQFSKEYEYVVVVAGNHEYYGCGYDLNKVQEKIRSVTNTFENVYFLNRDSVVIYGIEFIGATLWSRISHETFNELNDSKNEVFRTHFDMIQEFQKDFKFLQERLSSSDIRNTKIVVTHHIPTYNLIVQKTHECKDAFFTEIIDTLCLDNVYIWACGHIHESCTFEKDSTLFVVNPVGYPNEERVTVFSNDVYTI